MPYFGYTLNVTVIVVGNRIIRVQILDEVICVLLCERHESVCSLSAMGKQWIWFDFMVYQHS